MKTLKSFDFGPSSGNTKHDWDSILSGKLVMLEEGTDFTCTIGTFHGNAKSRAASRGQDLKIKKVEGGIVLQAGPPDAEKAAEWLQARKEKRAEEREARKAAAAEAAANGE